jgi:hypothetical protein
MEERSKTSYNNMGNLLICKDNFYSLCVCKLTKKAYFCLASINGLFYYAIVFHDV